MLAMFQRFFQPDPSKNRQPIFNYYLVVAFVSNTKYLWVGDLRMGRFWVFDDANIIDQHH
jgi:hypothetical protein